MFAVLSLQDIVEFYLQLCDYVKFFFGFPLGVSLQQNPGGILYICYV